MKILILGGTGDALSISQSLIAAKHNITYSIAGIVRQPKLDCRTLSGGFSIQQTPDGEKHFANGAEGLQWHLKEEAYDLVVDATHPYAIQISRNIVAAAKQVGVPVWRYLRAPWKESTEDNWLEFDSMEEITSQLKPYQKPFFTVGREVFSKADLRDPSQQWLVRSAGVESVNNPNISELKDIGPFTLEDEFALFKSYGVDALISKNSGGEAVVAKLEAARLLGIPVFILGRPDKATADQCFSSKQTLIEQINSSSTPLNNKFTG